MVPHARILLADPGFSFVSIFQQYEQKQVQQHRTATKTQQFEREHTAALLSTCLQAVALLLR